MFSNFAKQVSVLAVLISMTFASISAVQPKRAEAVIGGVTGAYAVSIVGIYSVTLPGTAVLGLGLVSHKRGIAALGGIMMALGMVMWDAQTGQTELRSMSLEQAHSIGADVTAAELQAYNENIDLLNVIADQIASEKPASVDASIALWNQYGADAPMEARIAGGKIVRAMIEKL